MRWFFAILLLSACSLPWNREYVPNPDPNHTHADFALYVQGMKIDFAKNQYMSGVVDKTSTHAEEHNHKHDYLHLHDGVGNVIHRHKGGLTIGDFFDSLGFPMRGSCVMLDNGVDVCNERGETWKMFVRNAADEVPTWEEKPFDPTYVFADIDQILLTFDSNDPIAQERIAKQQLKMSSDSCLYSRTCPWKGDPPTENCIADPEVPCVVPVE